MNIVDQIARLEQRLRSYVAQKVANLVYVAPITLTSSSGRGEGLDGRPADESSGRSVRRMQHSGFRSRPPAQSQAVAISLEGGAKKLVVVAEDDGADIALDEGEAKAYSPSKPNCRIWFDKDGALHIDADGVQDVIVNGGTAKVSRVGDATSGHTHAAGTLMCPNDGSGPIAVTGATASATDTMAQGAAHFKA